MLSVSVCICAYNEESNIGRAIRSVYAQRTDGFAVREVIVVSSGSEDGTDAVVNGMISEYPTLALISQAVRSGKNSAINEFLDAKSGDVSVLLNADNILSGDSSLQHLVSPFGDPKVGMTGGRPIPTNDPKDKIGFAAHMIWSMHHHVALKVPKIGELVAFRDIGIRLPADMQSDEDIIKMELEKNGFVSVYVPEAVVLNRGPGTKEDFLKQRTRVNIGEEILKKRFGCSVSTKNRKLLLGSLFGVIKDLGFHPYKMIYAMRLESKARRAAKRYADGGNDDMNIWGRVDSTKDVQK